MSSRHVAGLLAGVMLTLGACTTYTPNPDVSVPFDPAAFAWAEKDGENSITGSAVVRTRGGDPKTCAGLIAELIPATAYSRARIESVFGQAKVAFRGDTFVQFFEPAPNPAFDALKRISICEVQGQFNFSKLPDGGYFLIVPITWHVGNRSYMEGGELMREIEVRGGQSVKVMLSPENSEHLPALER